MTLKNINLKVSAAEHERMMAAADREFMPLTSLLRRLFSQYEQAKSASSPAPAKPKLNKRDQAFEEYHELMASLPTSWTEGLFQSTLAHIDTLRTQGGNITPVEMPLPKSMVAWKNTVQGLPGAEDYVGLSTAQLKELVDEHEFRGEGVPKTLLAMYNASHDVAP